VCAVNVRILLDKVVAKSGSKCLDGSYGVLFGEDVGGLLLGVGCDDDGVVGSGVTVNVELVFRTH
jgi:hypothetical protein